MKHVASICLIFLSCCVLFNHAAVAREVKTETAVQNLDAKELIAKATSLDFKDMFTRIVENRQSYNYTDLGKLIGPMIIDLLISLIKFFVLPLTLSYSTVVATALTTFGQIWKDLIPVIIGLTSGTPAATAG